jgi:hypothetical protein
MLTRKEIAAAKRGTVRVYANYLGSLAPIWGRDDQT